VERPQLLPSRDVMVACHAVEEGRVEATPVVAE
jgi:hypothetical protein